MNYTLEHHIAQIGAMQKISPEEMYEKKLGLLLDGIESGDLTIQDVLTYTNITTDFLRAVWAKRDIA